ncbi:MAG: hypothetical protein QG657_5478 [Acidobacteriota bacterium]|nr:hypothetical protein [Acidobacteriota bacterium]
MSNNNSTSSNLFSIDVEAHLKKAASHTFGSSSHYPVELVRAALKRGAGEVAIRVGRTRIQVTDNGPGMDTDALKTLTTLLDPTQPTELKEAAVETLQDRSGFGLLAIFAPAPSKIIIENVSVLEKTCIVFEKGRMKKFYSCDLSVGTRITLFNLTGRNPSREKYILRAYCRSVRQDIRLNNRIISRGPLLELSQLLASLNITGSNYISHGIIGVPRDGDICRLRLLDLGIPYRYVTFPPHQGFIFDAAVEYPDMSIGTANGEITGDFLDHLAEYAFQLYQWLCHNHASAPAPVQARMEELIFDHYRFTRSQKKISSSLMDHFAPFKTLGIPSTLTLAEIKDQARTAPIFAVPRHKEHLRYNTLGKTVLSLTREQADLLVNLEKLAITFLAPVFQKEKRLPIFFFSLKKGFKRLVFRFFGFLLIPAQRKVLNLDQLTLPEQLFMKAINGYLARQEETPVKEAVMVSSRGPFPSVQSQPSLPLLIRRDHPLVRKAVDAVQTDPRNLEIFMPLIARGLF